MDNDRAFASHRATHESNPAVSTVPVGIANAITIDSEIYKSTFYGILNKWGDFWTPLAFDSESKAKDALDRFWGAEGWNKRDFEIVPVRINLTYTPKTPQEESGRD